MPYLNKHKQATKKRHRNDYGHFDQGIDMSIENTMMECNSEGDLDRPIND